jgi:predicted SAM-dependent methyltransferase
MGWPSKKLAVPSAPDLVRVNIGCGTDYRPGWINVDSDPTGSLKVDRAFNLEDVPWPLADQSADYVLLSHVVEHMRSAMLHGTIKKALHLVRASLKSGKWSEEEAGRIEALAAKDGLIAVMEEVHRILRPGGLVDVVAPAARTPDAWRDPTHTRGVEADFWTYFQTGGLATRSFYSHAKFRLVRQEHLRSLDFRAPFRWLHFKDYHADKYLGPFSAMLKRLGARRWHYTRLQKP